MSPLVPRMLSSTGHISKLDFLAGANGPDKHLCIQNFMAGPSAQSLTFSSLFVSGSPTSMVGDTVCGTPCLHEGHYECWTQVQLSPSPSTPCA